MTNLWLFALALWKLGMLCGFIPSIIFVCAAEAWRKAQRVPARNLSGKVVSIEKPRHAAGMAGSGERGSIRLVG